MTTSKTIILCLLMLTAFAPSQAEGWRGIVPLHSTRADVERIIGAPVAPNGVIYRLASEQVFIEYSGGPCTKDRPGGYNVPRDTVIQISVSPNALTPLPDLQIGNGGYEKHPDPELPGVSHYTNREKGVSYVTHGDKVTTITYFPAAKDGYLHCPDNYPTQPELFASGELTAEGKALLDNLMSRLKSEQDKTGWIKINIEGKRAAEIATLTSGVIQYLSDKYGAESKRVTVSEGHRMNRAMELFLVSRDGEIAPCEYKSTVKN